MSQLGLSIADTARQLGMSTSGLAKTVAHGERPQAHWLSSVLHSSKEGEAISRQPMAARPNGILPIAAVRDPKLMAEGLREGEAAGG